MRKVCKFTLGLAVVALMPASPSLADPPDTLVSPPPHQHFLVTPDGELVPIGPDVCADPDLQQAFNEFHYNIHRSGSLVTLGPQNGAPGLHNGEGAEMIGIPGCDN